MRRTWMLLLIFASCVGGAVYGVKYYRTWRRFHAVTPGVLYRSNALPNEQYAYVLDKFGIKTVFSLTFTRNDEIQQICDERGITRHFHYMPGNGAGPDEPYLRFLEVIQDPKNHPVLVHCSAGVQRTGGAVALYRMIEQGWSLESALAEMVKLGNDGNKLQEDQIRRLHDRLVLPTIVVANQATNEVR